MILVAFALVGMVALVLCVVLFGTGGSSKKRMARRMEARAARLDYIRLARETDAANRRKAQDANSARTEETGQGDPSEEVKSKADSSTGDGTPADGRGN